MKAVDLFAGWGGFTLGAEQAGVEVVWAANHWQLAVDTHQMNHPAVTHVCQDLRQADWTRLPAYDLLLAGPACQGHSTASQPRRRAYHNAVRATAWAVVDCADVTEPEMIIVENVPAFRRWRLYPTWLAALSRLGYEIETHDLTASNFGVPQRRTRLFVVATRGRRRRLDFGHLGAEPAFGPTIEWDRGNWRPLTAMRGDRAAERVRRAQARHGPRCLVQHVTNHPGVPLDQPIRTITAQDQWIVSDGPRYRPLTIRELAAGMGFPASYRWPDNLSRRDCIRGLGNAVCPPVGKAICTALEEASLWKAKN